MATVTIPKKSKKVRREPDRFKPGRQFRVTEWTYQFVRALKDRSGLPMNEALEMVLRQVKVKEARP
jgi:hypothetical protein